MRFASKAALLGALLLAPISNAAYSEGWQPGQHYTKYLTSTSSASDSVPTSSPQYVPPKPSEPGFALKDLLSLEKILTQGPVSRIIQRFGFNVSAQLELAREGIPPRFAVDIPLLTDENYEDMLMEEDFASPEEEEERVWAIMVSIGTQDAVSAYFDKTFDGAHNITVQKGDLQNVRWARVDYLQVTEITTRWSIWKAPILVIAKDKGRELRFFKTGDLKSMRLPEQMREFLLNEEWNEKAPWTGPWSPYGNRAPYLAQYAKYSAKVYNLLAMTPRWLLLLITGTIASTAIQFLHSGEEEKMAKLAEEKKAKAKLEGKKAEEEEVPDWVKEQEKEAEKTKAAASPSKSGAKKRKGGKK